MTDRELLDRYLDVRDESAFEALIQRHGPMVLGLCRRSLRDANAADDAFQNTFLILVSNARSIHKKDSIGSWLYGVALKVVMKAKLQARRADRLTEGKAMTANGREPEPEYADLTEIRPVLHAEVGRLPEKYRAPIVLCYFEGQSHEKAAQQLDWPVGTVKGRLSRARELLHSRLSRRGISLSIGLVAILHSEASAAVPEPLIEATVRAAKNVSIRGSRLSLVSKNLPIPGPRLQRILLALAIAVTILLLSNRGRNLVARITHHGGISASVAGTAGACSLTD